MLREARTTTLDPHDLVGIKGYYIYKTKEVEPSAKRASKRIVSFNNTTYTTPLFQCPESTLCRRFRHAVAFQ